MYDKASGQIVHYVRTANPMSTSHRDDEDAIIYRDSVYSENAWTRTRLALYIPVFYLKWRTLSQ